MAWIFFLFLIWIGEIHLPFKNLIIFIFKVNDFWKSPRRKAHPMNKQQKVKGMIKNA